MSGIKRVFLLILIFIFLLLAAAGCRQQQGGQNSIPEEAALKNQPLVIRAGFLGEMKSLDPVKVKTLPELHIAKSIYEGLFSYDGITGQLVPSLVEEWSLDESRTSYTFTLKKGVTFHTGRSMTASDVKYSWERFLKKGHAHDLFYIFSRIEGAEEFLQGKNSEVTGIKALDDGLLQVQLESPINSFLDYLTHPAASVIDRQVVELLGERYGSPGSYLAPAPVLVGTGPFSFVEWIDQRLLSVQRFTQYHGEMSLTDRLEFYFYTDPESLWADWHGEYLDLGFVGTFPKNEGTSQDRFFESSLGNEVIFLGFHPGHQPYDLPELRQAVSLAVNREFLAAGVTGAGPMEGLLPRRLLRERSPLISYRYDPQEARRLLGDMPESNLVLSYPLVGDLPSLAEKIKNQLAAAGLILELQSFPEESFIQALKAGDLGFYLYYWPISVPLAESFLDANLYFPGHYFSAGFFDQAFHELREFIQSGAETDGDRLESLLQLEQMIMNQAPLIALLEKRNTLITQPGVEIDGEVSGGMIAWGKVAREK